MSCEIVVEVSPEETRVVVVENGKAVEVHVERAGDASLVGNVYLGRVDRVIPGMQSAFVDVGLERHAFLHVTDVTAPETDDEATAPVRPEDAPPIEKLLKAGQEVLVQVTREPFAGKGARLTTQVSLPGKLIVYLPMSDHVGVSKRITDEALRQSLRDAVLALSTRAPGGAIVRTDAQGQGIEALERELLALAQDWEALLRARAAARPPQLLLAQPDLALRIVRDAKAGDVARIVTDDEPTHERLVAWLERRSPELAAKVQTYRGPSGLFEALGFEQEIDKALRDRVWLKSGGTLIINQLEALVAIDVNTGKFTGSKKLEDTLLQTNMEAAREVARQLRLRDLGGIVVIDFIDMENPGHRQQVLSELEGALQKDRARTTVLGMSEFGLVQLTRQRQKRSLDRTLLDACPYCAGSGRLRSAETTALQVLRRVRHAALSGTTFLRVRAHPDVASALRKKESDLRRDGRPLGLSLEILDDPGRHRETFELTT
jgi:ribonuclease G